MISEEKLLVVAMAFPAPGHVTPTLQAVEHLVSRGHTAWFVGSAEFEPAARAAGASRVFHTFNPVADIGAIMGMIMSAEPGLPRLNAIYKNIFLRHSGKFVDGIRQALEAARAEYGPDRKVVVLEDSLAGGTIPFRYGVPLPRGYDALPPVVALHTSILNSQSVDVGPFLSVVPPDASEEGRERNRQLNARHTAGLADSIRYMNDVYRELGATREVTEVPEDVWTNSAEATVMLCSPSLEYPRSDLPASIRFVGGLPLKKSSGGGSGLPSQLEELVVANAAKPAAERPKVVFVTQGTTEFDYNDLVIPAIRAYAGRDDILVVATLGMRGGKLPEGTELPSNAVVVDYLPYNDILPYTDVMVTNAGYGGFIQSIMNGVPTVLGGENADKPEVAMRGEHVGVSVNLKTGHPTVEQLRAGIDKVLADPSYKKRAVELRAENEAMDSLTRIEETVLEVSRK